MKDDNQLAELKRRYKQGQTRWHLDDIAYLLSLLDSQAEADSGWLLEKMHEGSVHYISAEHVLQWTDDPNKALRLARREDAEALTTIVEDCEKIAEHEWPSSSLPAAANTEEATIE